MEEETPYLIDRKEKKERSLVDYKTQVSQNLAHNILNLRKSRGLTQERLSKLAKIPRSTITNFESGSGNPSLNNLIGIARALEVPVEELLVSSMPDITLIKQKNLRSRNKNNCFIFDLLPTPIKGLIVEKFIYPSKGHFVGIPHLKGTKEYYITLKGKSQVVVGGETFIVEEGDLLIFPGDEKHSYKNLLTKDCIALSLLIRDDGD